MPPLTLPTRLRLTGASTGLLLLLAVPAQAGSVTAESVWDRSNAIQRARSQLPAGASVTGTRCTDVNVRNVNDRYICTLDYVIPTPAQAPAPAPSPATAPSPNAPSAPAP